MPPIKQDIRPLHLSPEDKPSWISFCKVPPTLLTEEGISWMASQYGKPILKPVREGLTVKVCVLRGESSNTKNELKIHLGRGEVVAVEVVFPQARDYKREVKVWTATSQPIPSASNGNKEGPLTKPLSGREENEGSHETGEEIGSDSKTSKEVEVPINQFSPAKTSCEGEVGAAQSPVVGIEVHASAFGALAEDWEDVEATVEAAEDSDSAGLGWVTETIPLPEKPTFGEFLEHGTHFTTVGRGRRKGSGVKTRQQSKQ
ncbi:hypothetical protein LINPERHAP1_LOCUS5837 [Linum perenne]